MYIECRMAQAELITHSSSAFSSFNRPNGTIYSGLCTSKIHVDSATNVLRSLTRNLVNTYKRCGLKVPETKDFKFICTFKYIAVCFVELSNNFQSCLSQSSTFCMYSVWLLVSVQASAILWHKQCIEISRGFTSFRWAATPLWAPPLAELWAL